MRRLICVAFWAVALPALAGTPTGEDGNGAVTAISGLEELAASAAGSGQTVTMKPGAYRLTDYIPIGDAAERRKRGRWEFLDFSGSDNVFNLDGVIIEVDTALRTALRPPVHTSEFVVSGSGNVIRGLTLTHIGDGTSPGGAALSITGSGNTLRGCTIHVRGSFPYGYGDLFGKGGGSVIGHQKKSGIHIAGNRTSLFGCHLHMRSFGHGYFVQEDARDVRFEDCHVEGEMRSTDDMLAETTGPAFEVGFRTVARNRRGENKVTPGYMKSLAEDGFRTYGRHENLVLRNCTAKNMRGGFELRTRTGVRLENCTAIGNERGFWVSTGAKLVRCKGDARYGPLLFLEGDGASVGLELMPAESEMIVHALATIHGTGHEVTIGPWRGENRARPLPILVGHSQPGAGEGMSPIGEGLARGVRLRNETAMPVVVGAKASDCEIATRGPIEENAGQDVSVTELPSG